MAGIDLDSWCAAVPGLKKLRDGLWELPQRSGASFPAGGHASLAAIEPDSYWFNHRNDVITATVRRFPPAGTIFDIGGGNGYVSEGLRKAGFDCVVMEPGLVGAENSAARGFPTIRAPFQDLRIPSGGMPAIGVFDVLEHIEDEAAALSGFHAALKPGGRIYISVPAYNMLWSDEDVHAGHYRRYTLARLRNVLHTNGCTVEYDAGFFSALIVPIFLLRTLPTLLRGKYKPVIGDVSQDHSLPGGLIGRAIRFSFARELAKISSGRMANFGASFLIVGRKIDGADRNPGR